MNAELIPSGTRRLRSLTCLLLLGGALCASAPRAHADADVAVGAGIGAVTGSIIGHAVGGRGGGIFGAVLGAITGASIAAHPSQPATASADIAVRPSLSLVVQPASAPAASGQTHWRDREWESRHAEYLRHTHLRNDGPDRIDARHS